MAKIEIKNLYKDYTVEGLKTVHAVRNASLTVDDGEVVVIIGPSGSGKSTLLRCVNKLEEPTSGNILIDGVDVTDPATDLRKVREEVGMVFQSFNLFPHLSVLDNITLAPRKVLKMDRKKAEELGMELLERVGLADKAKNRPPQLSGGQQQRVAIARLDPEMIKEVLDVMTDLAHEGMTMLLVTHEMGFARAAADKVVFMDSGEIIEMASPEELFTNPKSPRTKSFLDHIL